MSEQLSAIRAQSRAREAQEKRIAERRKAALVLVLRFLVDSGYTDSYERLSTESNVSLNKVDAADNISLLHVLQEFEDSYEERYGTRVKLIRRLGPADAADLAERAPGGGGARSNPGHLQPPAGVLSNAPPALPGAAKAGLDGPPVSGAMAARQRRERGSSSAEDQKKAEALERRQKAMDSVKPPADLGVQRVGGIAVGPGGVLAGGAPGDGSPGVPQLAVAGSAVGVRGQEDASKDEGSDEEDADAFFQRRLLKPLPAHLRGELHELSAAISRDIFTDNPNVKWEDIAGLDVAKRLLVEAVVQPIKYPQLFTGLLAPWKGVLLYGPPGTGKTLLAKAVATECKTTFFNVQASTIISKWRGDSEKLVRVLFELARHHAPSTIFLDEIDALMMARGGESEHEASRRMKTELLIQMDGLAKSSAMVFVLAATNLPWELDMAMLRRLEKRILVPLPSTEARARIFQHLLQGRCAPQVAWADLADRTHGYSGSDVTLVAKEAAMRPLRRLMAQLEGPSAAVKGSPGGGGAGAGAAGKTPLQLEPVTLEDVAAALEVTKPSARLHEAKYKEFNDEYGQVGC